jgi:hypothetical protein
MQSVSRPCHLEAGSNGCTVMTIVVQQVWRGDFNAVLLACVSRVVAIVSKSGF